MHAPAIDEGVVEYICEGGYGSEASVTVELRTRFPGIGGIIITQEGVVTASRAPYNYSPNSGHGMFLRHMLIKKLDDFFHRTNVYNFAHIPRPLGSVSIQSENPVDAYLYEWAFGSEGFPWAIIDRNGLRVPVQLHDWNACINHFHEAGINLAHDVTDPDNGRISKNIIHQLPRDSYLDGHLSSLWKRIDFGQESVLINYDQLIKFLVKNRDQLVASLRNERYAMMTIAASYLNPDTRKSVDEFELGRLEELVRDYRLSSLQHYMSRGGSDTSRPAYSFDLTPCLTR